MSEASLWQRVKDMRHPEIVLDIDAMKKVCISFDRKSSPEFSMVVDFVGLLKNVKDVRLSKEDHCIAVANEVGVMLRLWIDKATSNITLADVMAFVHAYHNTGSQIFPTLISPILNSCDVEAFEYFYEATYYDENIHNDVNVHGAHIDFALIALQEPNPTDRSPRLRQFSLRYMKEHASERVQNHLVHKVVQADSLVSFQNFEAFFDRRLTSDELLRVGFYEGKAGQLLLKAFGGFDEDDVKQMSIYKYLLEREAMESEKDRLEKLLSDENIKPGKKGGL